MNINNLKEKTPITPIFTGQFRLFASYVILSVCSFLHLTARADSLLIPMDDAQADHLRVYGVMYAATKDGVKAQWLLNYRGGSFVLEHTTAMATLCRERGVTALRLTEKEHAAIENKVKAADFNGDIIDLTKPPRIAVYTPATKKPWDDAVTLALTYAGIPFDKLYVDEVLAGGLANYDWLHLHHEDFTGQLGKFWAQFANAEWYVADKYATERLAAKHHFSKISQMQLAVVRKIRDFVTAGGNLFAMCSATDTYDIALAADGVDICDMPFDGDPMDPAANTRLDYSKCFAFTGFNVSINMYEYEYSSIDNTVMHTTMVEFQDEFTLMPFRAKSDPVPSMLCQNHTPAIKGFMGQTSAFRTQFIKPGVTIMGARTDLREARYIRGRQGLGSWTFYGGHDPEDYQHMVNEAPTDLSQHPHSPGYRLILNNVLCMASGKKDAPLPHTTVTPSLDRSESASLIAIQPGDTEHSLVISATVPWKKIQRIAFVNAKGAEVLVKKYQDVSKLTIDMTDLPTGMYSIKVNDMNVGKVMKN